MSREPNILWITFDHQLFYKHETIKRPNFEGFKKKAVSFDNAFSVCPLCGPARRSMLNGLYPHSHGTVNNDISKPVAEETYFDGLKEAGYKHFYFGKWHAAPGTPMDLGAEGFSPEGYNNPYRHDDYKEYLKRYNLPEPNAYVHFSESDRHYFHEGESVGLTNVQHLYSYTFGELTTPKETHECYYLSKRACETLCDIKNSKEKQPFMLRVDFWGPHQPYFPTKEFLDMYDEKQITMYGSFYDTLEDKPPIYRYETGHSLSKNKEIILPSAQSDDNWRLMFKYAYAHNTMCDHAAGEILKCLKELGLDDNTVVIWTADHGDALGSHGGHIDKNCYLSEEMIRIPLAIRNPYSSTMGEAVNFPVSNLDIPVTVRDFIGRCFNNKTDGISLKSFTEGDDAGERDYFVSVSHGHFQKHIARAVAWNSMRYIYNKDMTDELYDLSKDPFQMKNLCNDNTYAEIKANLIDMLNDWREEHCDKEL